MSSGGPRPVAGSGPGFAASSSAGAASAGPSSAGPPSEFELIRRHFTRPVRHTRQGVGDDCALIAARPGMEIAISTDMLIEGTHFLPGAEPRALGRKTLAVNLSDLAAAGAEPRWATLALALPEADDAWIAAFASGFFALAERYAVDLIGGDTTRGARAFCVTVLGEVAAGRSLKRSGARPGEDVWVSGELGGAALALAARLGKIELPAAARAPLDARLDAPEPRIDLGRRLLGAASAAIDVSDGLAGDLAHICERSGVAARVEYALLPQPAALASLGDPQLRADCLLSGGDDYELLFTAPPLQRAALAALAAELALPLTRIGTVLEGRPGVAVFDAAGRPLAHRGRGYDHFA